MEALVRTPEATVAPLLDVRGLTTEFRSREVTIRANAEVSIVVGRGVTLGIVGESGSGKSVLCRSIPRLVPSPPGFITAGEVWFEGRDLLTLPEEEMRRVRGTEVRMIFQNPMTSLNPVWPIGDQITEGLRVHGGLSARAVRERGIELLRRVGIPSPAQRYDEYPFQWSGGMLQRAVIAMAVAGEPKLLLADEPTTALDVTIQAQILVLMRQLQAETGTAILFITHNLGVVAEIADHIAVMYAGRVVEEGDVRAIFKTPKHPYTKGLLASMPRLDEDHRVPSRLGAIPGNVPSPTKVHRGCAFAPRCPLVVPACEEAPPPLFETTAPGHRARCIRWSEV